MGEYADMAVAESLDRYWDDDDMDDGGSFWLGCRRSWTHEERVRFASARPSPASDFADLFDR